MSNPAENASELNVLRRALHEMKQMRSQIESLEGAKKEPIAVAGMGCRFPGGANNPDDLWRLLHDGVDAIREVPSDRWDVDAYFDPNPDVPGKAYTRSGGFLERADLFDAAFFRISAREAVSMDPQQRLLLETAWEALEHAGIPPARLVRSRTGVFIGITTNDYLHIQIERADRTLFDAYTATGNPLNFAAGRLSYVFGFQGPCIAVDAACASSLVSIHLACQSLRAGECDLALAGGVNLMLSPQGSVYLSKSRALAPDGRCKTFDAAADGMARGEGCGIVVLKRCSDALRDRDNILAVIRGSAIGQDGPSSGLTVPNGHAQEALIREALLNAGVKPHEVQYVEAHGTGTSLGDPIEVRALAAVLSEGRKRDDPVAIGSVKTNLGHLEAAAGVAGLIKTVLALHHEEIPPHLHLKNLTPHVAWDDIPVVVPTAPTPWPTGGKRRIAGVSAFGLSGIIAHLVMEEAPAVKTVAQVEQPPPLQLLTLSAKSDAALRQLAERYQQHLTSDGSASFADICFTANAGRAHFSHRLALLADSAGEAAMKLAALVRGDEPSSDCFSGVAERGQEPQLAFLFTGQGSQYIGMGRRLYETQPHFRKLLHDCEQMLEGQLQRPLLSVLYADDDTVLHETAYTQPALFALECALAELWRSWGIVPQVVAGHSLGEYVAACVAGIFSLPDGLRLVAERGRLMQTLPSRGAMAAVYAAEREVRSRLAGQEESLSVAALNGPENTVISGAEVALEQVLQDLEAAGIGSQRLRVSHGFHSPAMAAIQAEFAAAAAQVSYGKAQIGIVSNLTGRLAEAGEMERADYWVRQLRQPVRFRQTMETLREQGCGIYLEIGPKPTLLGLGQQCLGADAAVWLNSLRPGRDDWQEMLRSVGQLYRHGVEIAWQGFYGDSSRRVSLPTYPFQRKRYWFEEISPARLPERGIARAPVPEAQPADDWLYQVSWREKPLPDGAGKSPRNGKWLILADHRGLGRQLADRLEQNGSSSVLLFAPVADANPEDQARFDAAIRDALAAPDTPCSGVVYLSGLDDAFPEDPSLVSLQAAQKTCCAGALRLLQILAAAEGRSSPRLYFVTRGAQRVEPASLPPAIAQATLWGLGKVVAWEHPGLWGGLIDLDPANPTGDSECLLQELQNPDGETQVAYRDGCRRVARLTPLANRKSAPPGYVFRSDATYLITGGLGGIGLNLTRWMAQRGARHLLLMGRSAPSGEALGALAELERAGARVVAVRADVSRPEELAAALAGAAGSMPPLRGVIHAAGVLADGALLQQTWDRFEAVMAPKIIGSWNLHQTTRGLDLDFFVLFSSASALFGAPGQANYAAANAFLDGLAEYRRSLGLPAVSVNWAAWAETGMAAKGTDLGKRPRTFADSPAISPARGAEILERIIAGNFSRAAVLPVDWGKFVEHCPEDGLPLFVSELADAHRPAAAPESAANFAAELRHAAPTDRPDLLAAYLRRQVAKVLGGEEPDIAYDRSLLELGIDSLMVMELFKTLKRDLGLTLYPREFYEHPSIASLAKYLAAEFDDHRAQAVTAPAIAAITQGVWTQTGTTAPIPLTAHERAPGIVFLLSSPRAGSTLLRVMMAGHPTLFCPPELHLLPFDTMAHRRDALASNYLGEGLQRAFMELQNVGAEQARAFLDQLAERQTPTCQVYGMMHELASGRLVVDKSPSYATSLETLTRAKAYCDGARYIHLVRHPHAVIESFVRRRFQRLIPIEHADPYELAEQLWTASNHNALQFLASVEPQRRHLIRYEDLVSDPATAMLRLCQFLGIPFDEALMTPYDGQRMTDGIHPQSLSIGDPGFLDHRTIEPELGDAWKSVRLPRRLGAPARAVAAELGYSLPVEAAPAALQPVAPHILEHAPMRERYLDVRGLKLCLCEWGPNDGSQLLCLHGMLDHGAVWEPVAVELARRGFAVAALDQRGHGLSEHVGKGGSYHGLDFLADADALVRILGKRPLTLVGHSMGAAMAVMLAGSRPDAIDNLVLIECPFPPAARNGAAHEQMVVQLDYLSSSFEHRVLEDVSTAALRLQQANNSLPMDLALRLASRITEPCKGGVRWRWDARLQTRAGLSHHAIDSLNQSAYFEILGRVQAPVTLIYADASNFVKPESMAVFESALARSRRVILPGGHNLHLDAFAAVADVIASSAVSR